MSDGGTADHGGVTDGTTARARRHVTLDFRTESTSCGDVQVIRPAGLVEREDVSHIQRTVLSSPLPVIIELARRGVRSRVAVSGHLQDALQAGTSACADDGSGWSAA